MTKGLHEKNHRGASPTRSHTRAREKKEDEERRRKAAAAAPDERETEASARGTMCG